MMEEREDRIHLIMKEHERHSLPSSSTFHAHFLSLVSFFLCDFQPHPRYMSVLLSLAEHSNTLLHLLVLLALKRPD